MTFSWLGFVVGFLSGIIIMIILSKIGEMVRVANMIKYQALMKGKEGGGLDELVKGFKEKSGVTGTGDDSKTNK
jgi:hypothetical protein